MTARMWFLLCVYHHMLCKIIFNCNYYIGVISPLCIFPYTFQECLYTQNLLTVSAWIWSLPCVYLHMINKMTSLYKSYLSMAACMWFLPCMYLEILCKIRFFVESLLTMTALMWFFSCVYLHVHYKSTFPCKNLLTVSALVWSIPCVYFHMIYKITLCTMPIT